MCWNQDLFIFQHVTVGFMVGVWRTFLALTLQKICNPHVAYLCRSVKTRFCPPQNLKESNMTSQALHSPSPVRYPSLDLQQTRSTIAVASGSFPSDFLPRQPLTFNNHTMIPNKCKQNSPLFIWPCNRTKSLRPTRQTNVKATTTHKVVHYFTILPQFPIFMCASVAELQCFAHWLLGHCRFLTNPTVIIKTWSKPRELFKTFMIGNIKQSSQISTTTAVVVPMMQSSFPLFAILLCDSWPRLVKCCTWARSNCFRHVHVEEVGIRICDPWIQCYHCQKPRFGPMYTGKCQINANNHCWRGRKQQKIIPAATATSTISFVPIYWSTLVTTGLWATCSVSGIRCWDPSHANILYFFNAQKLGGVCKATPPCLFLKGCQLHSKLRIGNICINSWYDKWYMSHLRGRCIVAPNNWSCVIGLRRICCANVKWMKMALQYGLASNGHDKTYVTILHSCTK